MSVGVPACGSRRFETLWRIDATGLAGFAATGAGVGEAGAPQAARTALPLASRPHLKSPRRVIAMGCLSSRACALFGLGQDTVQAGF